MSFYWVLCKDISKCFQGFVFVVVVEFVVDEEDFLLDVDDEEVFVSFNEYPLEVSKTDFFSGVGVGIASAFSFGIDVKNEPNFAARFICEDISILTLYKQLQ